VPVGKVNERAVMSAVDLFPTICAITGAKVPSGAKLDGIDVAPVWLGNDTVQRGPLYWEYGRNDKPVFKYGEDRSPSLAVRKDNWKLLMNPDRSKVELYDLSTDKKEAHNLAAEKPEIAKELARLVMDWRGTWPKRK
jgi:arylsulfatase A-like enzyme